MSLDRYQVIGTLAYQGKEGCADVRCTRWFVDGVPDWTRCMGYHCSYCDQPCSSQGHRCDASQAILGEALRAAQEGER